MKVYVRTDASVLLGTIHVMRCLTLADRLLSRGAEVCFLCRETEGSMIPVIRERGYPAIALPAAPHTDRPHAADLLLDQNKYKDGDQPYLGLVPSHCRVLLGPLYSLTDGVCAERTAKELWIA